MYLSKSKQAVLAGFFIAAITVPIALSAKEDPLFDFIPPGGRILLGELIAKGKVKPEDVVSSDRNLDEWLAYIGKLGDLGLDNASIDTLAAYLQSTMPMAAKGGKSIDAGGLALPRDGRDLTLEYCQSCHIITVVVTQDRTREAWLGTMNKPSHVEIDTTETERGAIADYLVLNGGISSDDVPEELRAGGATY